MTPQTLGDSFNQYMQRADFRSAHTMDAYRRAGDLFFEFLNERSLKGFLPIQQTRYTLPQEIDLTAFSPDDEAIIQYFAEWLLSGNTRHHSKAYSIATTELRVAGVIHWFQFMANHKWLPDEKWVTRAIQLGREALKQHHQTVEEKAVVPPPNLDAVIRYYDTLPIPASLKKGSAARFELWEVKRLRNRALLHLLAETGGRVSEILSLEVGLFRGASQQDTVDVTVIGKGGHEYAVQLESSLGALVDYLRKRGSYDNNDLEPTAPVFISHDPRYEGQRMSRIVAWRVVRRAAKALNLPAVSPQDFRHWRAAKLIDQGYSLEEIQTILGHRSIETVKAFYAHLKKKKD